VTHVRWALGLPLVAALATCTGSNPPHARAQRIGKLEQTIGGPHAIGRIGDFLLENDQVRFIIADKGTGRVNTMFGGSLVDADLQRVGGDDTGDDQVAELLPGFVFTVIDPTEVCVPTKAGVCPCAPGQASCEPGSDQPLVDGSDGGAAEVMVRGTGADLFEMVALLNTGLVYPATLEMTQLYKLEPGKKYVTIETTIRNTASGAHPFPYLQPQELANLGFNVPGIQNLQLSAPLGQLPLMGADQELFAPGVAGFNVRFAIEDSYKNVGGFPAFPGLVIDYLATRGKGVSYGIAMPDSDDDYPMAYASGYPGQTVTKHSMLLPFTYAGVTGAYMYKPPDTLEAGEERTYTSYFVVGRGDVGSVYDTVLQLRGTQTGTFGGRVVDELSQAPVGSASVMVLDAQNHPIDQLSTDAGGAFLGHLPAGNYTYQVLRDDRLTTAPQAFTITAGQATGVFVQMKPPATLAVQALDELGRHAPMKIQLLGHDPRVKGVDGRNILYSLALGERVRPTAFDGTDRYVEQAWWTADGRVDATVRPGTYDLVISRGPEYELTTKTITLRPGQFDAEHLQLQRSYTSDGWVAGDFHVHAQPSTDSDVSLADRVTSCAAEGLEVAAATDHNYLTDYTPVIANKGLDEWLLGVTGMELTTFEMGHFIGFPLKVDPGSTRGGEFVWAHQKPQQIFDTLRGLALDPKNVIVDIAHPRQAVLGYFAQFYIDAATAEPYTPTGLLGVFAPYGDEFQAQNFSYDFDAMELITGRRIEDVHSYKAPDPLPPGPFPDPQPVPGQVVMGKDGRPAYPGVVETWFTMLDRGLRPTGLGASDSHHTLGDEPGYARTLVWVGKGKDVPGGFSRDDVVAGIKGHHAIATNAPFIDMTIDGHMIGDTIVDTSGTATVQLHVRAPSWAPVDHLVVYSNSNVVYDQPIPGPGTDYTTTIQVPLTQDAWVVAEVTGTHNMFPVLSPTEFPPLDATIVIGALSKGLDLSTLPLTAKIAPIRTHFSTPYAITNPIWIDVDGNGWTPPMSPLSRTAPPPALPRPDVRAAFDALPDVSP
jgi:hypothetical protein